MSRALLACAAAALGLSACAVGPTYRKPDPTPLAPQRFAETSPVTAPAPPPDAWWRLYDDAALNGYVEAALKANTDLRQAAANLELAQAALAEARGQRLPATDLTADASEGRAKTTTGAAAPIRPTYGFGFTVAYDLDLFGRLKRGVEAARADVGARTAALDLARTEVAAATTRAYVQACAYAQEAEVARRSVTLVGQSYDITRRQRDLGAATDFDVQRAAALFAQTRAPVPQLEAQRRSALYALAVLTGEAPEHIPAAAAACRSPPQLAQPLPMGDGRGLLARRPDVRAAERTLAGAVARIGVSTADLYPTITLGGSVAGSGANAEGLTSDRGLTFGVGPALSWTLPNVVVARARIAQSEAAARGALAAFDGTVLTALRETETALAAYTGELDRNAALGEAQAAAAESLRLATLRFQLGSTSFLDTLDAQRTLVDAQAAYAASQTALASDQVDVFKALGGGWGAAPDIVRPPLPTR